MLKFFLVSFFLFCIVQSTLCCDISGAIYRYSNTTSCLLDVDTNFTLADSVKLVKSWKLQSEGFYCSEPDKHTGIVVMCRPPSINACCTEENMSFGCACGQPNYTIVDMCVPNCPGSTAPLEYHIVHVGAASTMSPILLLAFILMMLFVFH